MKPNPLLIIGIIFAASFSGRVVTLANAASENLDTTQKHEPVKDKKDVSEPTETHDKLAQKAEDPGAHVDNEPAVAESADAIKDNLSNAEMSAMLAAMKERAASLDKREARIVEREAMLTIADKRLDEKLEELKTVKSELESRLSFAETAAQEDISQLARMYERMKPQKAGEIFNAMEPSFAAGFLTEMNSESAALILASMETEKAYATSIIIAGRNASVNRP